VVELMRRGEIWLANFNPSRGRETGKIRPALVIQADWLGPEATSLIVVLPLSSRVEPGSNGLLHVPLPARDRLLKPSIILADQPRTLDRSSLVDGPLAVLTDEEMTKVRRTLLMVLGLEDRR
jgi:mRNA interferase MazF